METYSCEYYGGNPHPGFDCQTWNMPVFKQGPYLKEDITDLKLQMNEIMELIHEKYQIHEPPVSFDEPEGSDDDTEVIFDEEQF
ncbi:hypothetical protein Tco_1296600 [Tanacetum coccineum]